jgi:uncharacterized membrane protein YphA (DoxX/SURF4 family)
MSPISIYVTSLILFLILLYIVYIYIYKKFPEEGWIYNKYKKNISIVMLPLILISLVVILYIFVAFSY